MKIHEYQAKELLKQYGIPTTNGGVATSAEDAARIAKELGGKVVVKAQIHAGGRGKGGGVKVVDGAQEAETAAAGMLGKPLVTYQTGPEGQVVSKVLVEGAVGIASELYLGMVVDRASEKVAFMASTEGGVEIEKVAAETPEKILKEFADPGTGLMPFQARNLAYGLGLEGNTASAAVSFIMKLYRLFIEKDCPLAEINPLIITDQGDVMALDAKLNFDDNALFRHSELAELRDLSEEDPSEVKASEFGLSYIKLDGAVGCMVNGAGLAMATMDIIKQAGAQPANFLDVGGGASAGMVENGLRLILRDDKVKAVLINIFGGILRCDIFAEGIVNAARAIGLRVPVVVRMEGTNVEEGKRILADSGLNLVGAKDLRDAAAKIAAAVA